MGSNWYRLPYMALRPATGGFKHPPTIKSMVVNCFVSWWIRGRYRKLYCILPKSKSCFLLNFCKNVTWPFSLLISSDFLVLTLGFACTRHVPSKLIFYILGITSYPLSRHAFVKEGSIYLSVFRISLHFPTGNTLTVECIDPCMVYLPTRMVYLYGNCR